MIFTLDGRDNFFLDVIKARGTLTYSELYDEINAVFEELKSSLKLLKVNYNDLKNALITNTTKREVALVFDSRKVDSDYYGPRIFEALIPLFEKKNSFSVLCGDLVGDNSMRPFLRAEFLRLINSTIDFDYQHHDHFFIVYINNLSDAQITAFENGLFGLAPYVGYFEMTYSSPMKTYLSMILVKHFIKAGGTILTPDEATQPDFNFYGYSFENHGYRCNTVYDMYYRLFLSFKIEREVFTNTDNDNRFSLSSISGNVLDITEFELNIDKAKLKYLLEAKKGSMERSGFHFLDISELKEVIKSKLQGNYLYNLDYNKIHNVLKFNMNIETERVDKDAVMKIIVSFEYRPNEKILRLITMY